MGYFEKHIFKLKKAVATFWAIPIWKNEAPFISTSDHRALALAPTVDLFKNSKNKNFHFRDEFITFYFRREKAVMEKLFGDDWKKHLR